MVFNGRSTIHENHSSGVIPAYVRYIHSLMRLPDQIVASHRGTILTKILDLALYVPLRAKLLGNLMTSLIPSQALHIGFAIAEGACVRQVLLDHLKDGRFMLSFTYDETLNDYVKQLPQRTWEKNIKKWIVNDMEEKEVLDHFRAVGINIRGKDDPLPRVILA